MSDFASLLLKGLMSGGGQGGGLLGKNYATQQQPWNPAAGLYNGGMGAQYTGQSPQQPRLLGQTPPGGDASNPNPDYDPSQKKPQGILGMIGNAVMPQAMSSMGKGGGIG